MSYINVCQIIMFCKLSGFFYRSSAIHLEKIICQMIVTMAVSLHCPLTSTLNDFVHICEGRSSTVGSTWFHSVFFYENSHCLSFYYSFLFVLVGPSLSTTISSNGDNRCLTQKITYTSRKHHNILLCKQSYKKPDRFSEILK